MAQTKDKTQPAQPAPEKRQIGIRLSPEALRLRQELSEQLGVDGTAVIELAIRALARQEAAK